MNRIESRYNVHIHAHSLLLFLHESNEQVIAGDLSTTTFKVNGITLCTYVPVYKCTHGISKEWSHSMRVAFAYLSSTVSCNHFHA